MGPEFIVPERTAVIREFLTGLVPDDQLSPVRFQRDASEYSDDILDAAQTERDFIFFAVRDGYLNDEDFTDIVGYEVICISATLERAEELARAVVGRIASSQEGISLQGHPIYVIRALRGYDEPESRLASFDTAFIISLEMHIGPRWRY